MRLVFALLLAGCLAERPVTMDVTSIDVPRGAGTEIVPMMDGQPLPIDEVAWLADDPTLVSIDVTDQQKLRVTGVREGDTTVYLGSHGTTLALPTHVAPPAVVQLWVEPAAVTTSIGSAVPVIAKELDTTGAVRDVTVRATWSVSDPDIARFGTDMRIHGSSSGTTTLDAALEGAVTSVSISVE